MNAPTWLPRKKGARALLIGVVLLVLFNLALFWLNQAAGGPSGPTSSSYATSSEGVRAYADLLVEEGHEVDRLRSTVDELDIEGTSTIVMLDPGTVTAEEADALHTLVERGGRLVVSVAEPAPWLDTVTGERIAWSAGGPTDVGPLVVVPEVAGVGAVRAEGGGRWEDLGGAVPVLGDGTGDGVLLAVASVGAGRVALLADDSPLQNRLLASGDNAALGLALAGGTERPILFAESHHGYGEATGLSALPSGWKTALAGLGLAALVLVVARGRRLGPPEQISRDLAPPPSPHTSSYAGRFGPRFRTQRGWPSPE